MDKIPTKPMGNMNKIAATIRRLGEEKRMSKATVTCTPFLGDEEFFRTTRGGLKASLVVMCETTSDLPQDAIGEAVTECIRGAWSCGIDPVTDKLSLSVRVTFG